MFTEKNKIVNEEKKLTRTFNDHYMNIVKRFCGRKLKTTTRH